MVNYAGLIGIAACVAGLLAGGLIRDVNVCRGFLTRAKYASDLLKGFSIDTLTGSAGKVYKEGLHLPLPYPAIVPVESYQPGKLPEFGALEVGHAGHGELLLVFS